jgi:DNA-binding response OmpR family regulator
MVRIRYNREKHMARTRTAQKRQRHILIIEDEKPLSHALQMKLLNEGYAVIIAEDGQEALDLIRAQKFDLLLLDIIMPRMDGFTLLEMLKKAGKFNTLPVLVLSNLGQEEDIQKARALGVTDYLVKANSPISSIIAKINHLLQRQ